MLRHFYYKSITELETKYFRTWFVQNLIPTKHHFSKNLQISKKIRSFEHDRDISGVNIYFNSMIKTTPLITKGYFW